MNDFKTKYYWLFNPFPQEGDGGGVLLPFLIFPRDLFAFLLRLPFGQFTDSLSSYPCIYEINFQNYYLEKRWGEGGGRGWQFDLLAGYLFQRSTKTNN